jgi:hypothetical protein
MIVNSNFHRANRWLVPALLGLLLTACANDRVPTASSRYRCEHNIEFAVRFEGDSAVLDGSRGYEVLYRKPGEAASLYRNARMSAEFAPGGNAREALLRYPLLPLLARCVQD